MTVKTILQNSACSVTLFEGRMTDFQQRSETIVTGGGSSYYTTIDSRTDVFTQIFLVDEQGNQHTFSTENWDIPMRTGNDLKVIALSKTGSATHKVVLLHNVSLQQVSWSCKKLKTELKKIYFPFLKWGLISFFVLPFVLFFVLFVFIQPESEKSFIATLFAFLIGMCQLFGLGSLIYGYHFRWRHQYFKIKKLIQDYL